MGDGANPLALSKAEIETFKTAKVPPAEIEAKFGKPQAIFESKVVKWLTYAGGSFSSSHYIRKVGIDRAGNVCEKIESIWWN
ncbi:MAG: hypothetical protein MUF04_10615 [Akkermansiaceae bacterium]|nr:hypothetical protein [Akkermansiaceae bacterium]